MMTKISTAQVQAYNGELRIEDDDREAQTLMDYDGFYTELLEKAREYKLDLPPLFQKNFIDHRSMTGYHQNQESTEHNLRARPLSLHNLVSPISGLPTHLYQAHLYRAHLYQTSFLPSSKYGRTHSGKLALTGDPGAGAPTHDFCLRQKSFGLFSIVPGPPW